MNFHLFKFRPLPLSSMYSKFPPDFYVLNPPLKTYIHSDRPLKIIMVDVVMYYLA